MNRLQLNRVIIELSPHRRNIAHYLDQAARLRNLAGGALSPEARESLFALARGYERMAAHRGRRLSQGS